MTREDVVLLLAAGATGPYDLDRFRLMKGCFLVEKLSERPGWEELFRFRAYDYGPFDPSVYSAREVLLSAGLLESDSTSRYGAVALTPSGQARVQQVEQDMGNEMADWIRSIGRWVTSRSFSNIVSIVYKRFPQYATRSVLRH